MNQFEIVTASFNNQQKQVSASHSQFQQSARTNLNWSQPVSTISKKQFELVTAIILQPVMHNQYELCLSLFKVSFSNKQEPVWTSHRQLQQPVRTSLN